jgi:hypothetical protein
MARVRRLLGGALRSALHLRPERHGLVTIRLEAIILDYPCTTCSGTGRLPAMAGLCTQCEASGYVLTQRGRDLIDFLNRHGIRSPR